MLKYDCVAPINALLHRVSFRINSKHLWSLSGFVLGATAGQPDFCAMFLKEGSMWTTSDPITKRTVSRRWLTDPRVMPLTWWRRIPADYFWALTHAWDTNTNDKNVSVAEEFLRIIKLIDSEWKTVEGANLPRQEGHRPEVGRLASIRRSQDGDMPRNRPPRPPARHAPRPVTKGHRDPTKLETAETAMREGQ